MRTSQLAALVFIACLPLPAMAYIDPGSGSAIMSAIIGFLVATWLMVKTYWYKIKSFFMPNQPAETAEENPDAAPEEPGK